VQLPQQISNVHTLQIGSILEMNKRLLLQGYEDFSNSKVANTVGLLEQIHQNVSYLAQAADY
jgi:hypothetical protein